MLRLWPETIAISLFPGVAWIAGKGAAAAPLVFTGTGALLDQLRLLLDAQDPPLRPGSRIVLTVSDTVANIVALRWQPNLQRTAEVNAYARASFEHAGVKIDEGWAMYAEFRNMNAMGLAYSIPNAWLEELIAELTVRNLKLATVLPLSAAIYFERRPRHGTWPAVVVARERDRHVACVFGPAGLIGYDVEAVIGSSEQSARRLSERLAALHGATPRQAAWVADVPTHTPDNAICVGAQPWQGAS